MAAEENTPARRAFRMASMGAGVAGSYLGYILQRAFVGKAEGERKLKSTHTRAARKMRAPGDRRARHCRTRSG